MIFAFDGEWVDTNTHAHERIVELPRKIAFNCYKPYTWKETESPFHLILRNRCRISHCSLITISFFHAHTQNLNVVSIKNRQAKKYIVKSTKNIAIYRSNERQRLEFPFSLFLSIPSSLTCTLSVYYTSIMLHIYLCNTQWKFRLFNHNSTLCPHWFEYFGSRYFSVVQCKDQKFYGELSNATLAHTITHILIQTGYRLPTIPAAHSNRLISYLAYVPHIFQLAKMCAVSHPVYTTHNTLTNKK